MQKSLNYKVLGRKISRFEEYKIATTMIKSQIVNNAIKIWQFLDEVQVSSVFEIEKRLQMQRQDVLIALGWLACEDKIYFLGDKKDSKIMLIADIDEE